MACRPGCCGLQGLPFFEKLGVDVVDVVVVEDKDVFVPA